MGRPRKLTRPKDKTTWAVSVDLSEKILRFKKRKETVDDFINRIFQQWTEWKDTISFLEEAYQKQSLMIESYVNEINSLKQPVITNS